MFLIEISAKDKLRIGLRNVHYSASEEKIARLVARVENGKGGDEMVYPIDDCAADIAARHAAKNKIVYALMSLLNGAKLPAGVEGKKMRDAMADAIGSVSVCPFFKELDDEGVSFVLERLGKKGASDFLSGMQQNEQYILPEIVKVECDESYVFPGGKQGVRVVTDALLTRHGPNRSRCVMFKARGEHYVTADIPNKAIDKSWKIVQKSKPQTYDEAIVVADEMATVGISVGAMLIAWEVREKARELVARCKSKIVSDMVLGAMEALFQESYKVYSAGEGDFADVVRSVFNCYIDNEMNLDKTRRFVASGEMWACVGIEWNER